MFSPLFVCLLFVGYLKKLCRRILTKLTVQVWCVTKTNWLDFGEDPDRITYLSDSSPLTDRTKNNMSQNTVFQKVVEGFGRNLVDRLGVGQGRID